MRKKSLGPPAHAWQKRAEICLTKVRHSGVGRRVLPQRPPLYAGGPGSASKSAVGSRGAKLSTRTPLLARTSSLPAGPIAARLDRLFSTKYQHSGLERPIFHQKPRLQAKSPSFPRRTTIVGLSPQFSTKDSRCRLERLVFHEIAPLLA